MRRRINLGAVARPTHIARGDLVRRLEAALCKKLVLVTAPAGYGKTASLRELWDALEDRDCVRVRPAPSVGDALGGDADPSEFISALAHSCAQAALNPDDAPDDGPDDGPDLATPHRDAGSPEATLANLVQRLKSRPRPVVIFIDEYDDARTPETDRLLKMFLQQTPACVRVVLAARSEPACGAAKMRLEGKLAEFTHRDLAFSLAETQALFKEEGLTQSGAESLAAKTQGWPAALALAKLWMKDGDGAPSRAAAFSGSHPMVANYLTQEVFASTPADVQRFLIETALFPVFDKELADEVLLRRDSETMLHRLESLDGFILAANRSRGGYRHHPLVADYLYSRLHELGDADYIDALHKRAAAFFDRRGEFLLALEHAIAAGDNALIESILKNPCLGFIQMTADERPFMRVLGRLEQCIPNKPEQLRPGAALRRIRQGRLIEAKDILDSAQLDLEALNRNKPSTIAQADYCAIDAIYHVYADTREDDNTALIARLGTARAARPMDEPIYVSVLNEALGVFRFRSGDIAGANDAFGRAADNFAQAQCHSGSIRNNFHRGVISMVRADISGAQGLYDHARRLHQKYLPDETALSAMIDVSEAALSYENGALASAYAILPQARRAIVNSGDYWIELLSVAFRLEARLTYSQRGFDEALGVLDRGLELARERSYDRLKKSLMAQKLHLAAIADQLDAAKKIEAEINQSFGLLKHDLRVGFGWREDAERALAQIRFEIARGRGDLAADSLDAFDKTYEPMGLEWLKLKSGALWALALAAKGEPAEAVGLLRPLLEQGEALAMYAFFLEEGSLAQALLDEAARRFSRTKKADAFNAVIVNWLVASSSYLPPEQRRTAPELTKQQRRILALLLKGFDRNAIAEQAGTTRHNIQYHLKKMFEMFGVASSRRLQAEAIRLGLVDDADTPPA